MTPPSDQNSSSLDPALLRELLAAEAGESSALLNDTPLLDDDVLGDDTPLVTIGPEGRVIPQAPPEAPAQRRTAASRRRAPDSGWLRTETHPAPTMEPAGDTPAPVDAEREPATAPIPPAEEAPSASPAPVEPAIDAEAVWHEEEPPLTQTMLDTLVAEADARRTLEPATTTFDPATAPPQSADAASLPSGDLASMEGWTESLMSQDELDQMLHAPDAPAAKPVGVQGAGIDGETPSPRPGTDLAPDEDTLSQEEMDALIASPSAPDGPAENSVEESMSQEDLDALIAGATADEGTGGEEDGEKNDDEPMSQEDLDALIAGATADEGTDGEEDGEKNDDEPMSQEDLDALIAGATADEGTGGEEDGEKNDDEPMSQEDLDALIAGATADEGTDGEEDGEKNDDQPMSQEDLDALIAGATADEGTDGEEDGEKNDDEPMSQEDLDALIAGATADEGTGGEEDDEKNDDEPMSQEDLDALIAGATADEAPEPTTTASDSPLSQEDLDALIAGATGDDSGEDEADTQESLSQDDLDALLAAASGEAPVEADDASQGDDSVQSLSEEDIDGLFDGASTDNDRAEAAFDDDAPLDQSSIDALLSTTDEDQTIGAQSEDAPVVDGGQTEEGDVSLTRSSIDSLMADLDDAGTVSADSASQDAPSEDDDDIGDVSQDMIDALIASAQAEAPGSGSAAESEVGSENLAAAATASEPGPDLLSQSDLDKLIEESRQQDKERSRAKQRALEEAISAAQRNAAGDAAPDPEPARETARRFRKPGIVWPFIRDNFPRVAASVLVGFTSALTVGTGLYLNREIVHRGPDQQAVMELEVAMDRARDEMGRGDYGAAVEELVDPVRHALPSKLRNDARYLLLEARYRAYRGEWGTSAFEEMTALIDELVDEVPNHPRAPEALYWKAQLYREDLPHAALEIYESIFDAYSTAPDMDKMLLEAAQLSLELKNPLDTAIHAQNLLQRFPGSPWAGQARLAYADANLIAGNTADARATFVRIAESERDSALGAEAYLRLGKLAFEEGEYDQAIMQLSRQLETTTTTEGNDEVYLLLARSQRKAGRLGDARDTLTDLLNVFEPSDVTPQAFIEYAQVFEDLGERENAVKAAQRAALEYPSNPDVLRNHAEFQGLDGNPLTAAIALVQADDAGAADPNLLLTAARYYRAANMPREAATTYGRLKSLYGGSPASLAGGIEAAELRYEQGQAEGALDDLKALQDSTRGTEHYLPATRAMLDIYKDLGLNNHVVALAEDVARLSDEPDVIANAAIDLIQAGDLERAQTAMGRTEMSRLSTRTAFDVLMKEGEALLSVAPQRGLDKMEEAYFNYPEARSPESDQQLLDTYLATGRAAAARRMVMDLKSVTDQKPVNAPYLVDAAVAWGNYLYDKEDYRTAVFAYNMAEEAGTRAGEPVAGLRSDPAWAKYQRANALLRLADYEGCLSLYDEIAASESPWAAEAEVKAELARLEQRQRGVPVASAQAG